MSPLTVTPFTATLHQGIWIYRKEVPIDGVPADSGIPEFRIDFPACLRIPATKIWSAGVGIAYRSCLRAGIEV